MLGCLQTIIRHLLAVRESSGNHLHLGSHLGSLLLCRECFAFVDIVLHNDDQNQQSSAGQNPRSQLFQHGDTNNTCIKTQIFFLFSTRGAAEKLGNRFAELDEFLANHLQHGGLFVAIFHVGRVVVVVGDAIQERVKLVLWRGVLLFER